MSGRANRTSKLDVARPGEIRVVDVCALKMHAIRPAKIRPAEVRLTDARPAEVGPP